MDIPGKPQIIDQLLIEIEETTRILGHNERLRGIYQSFLGEDFGKALDASDQKAAETVTECNDIIQRIGGIPVRLSLDDEVPDRETIWEIIRKDNAWFFRTSTDPRNEQYLTTDAERLRQAYFATLLLE